MKILNIAFISVFALILGGCIAKTTPQTQYFALDFSKAKCVNQSGKIPVFVTPTTFLDGADSRSILVIQNGEVVSLDAKFIKLPSEMIYQNLILAINDSCDFSVSLQKYKIQLDSKILAFHIKNGVAEILLGFSILKDKKEIKSSVLDKRVAVDGLEPKFMASALNKAFGDALNEILQALKDTK